MKITTLPLSNLDLGPWLRELAHEESEAPDDTTYARIWPAQHFVSDRLKELVLDERAA